MIPQRFVPKQLRQALSGVVAGAALLLLSPVTPVSAQQVTMETLLDRIQIEDLLTREQGREDTELVKLDGKWLIKRRYISSDSGTPDRFDETYEYRENPLD